VRWLTSWGYHVRDLASHALRERLDGQIVTIGHDTRLEKNNLHVYVKIERNARLLWGHRIPLPPKIKLTHSGKSVADTRPPPHLLRTSKSFVLLSHRDTKGYLH